MVEKGLREIVKRDIASGCKWYEVVKGHGTFIISYLWFCGVLDRFFPLKKAKIVYNLKQKKDKNIRSFLEWQINYFINAFLYYILMYL